MGSTNHQHVLRNSCNPSGGDYQEGQEGGGGWVMRAAVALPLSLMKGPQSELSAPFHDHLLYRSTDSEMSKNGDASSFFFLFFSVFCNCKNVFHPQRAF